MELPFDPNIDYRSFSPDGQENFHKDQESHLKTTMS